GYSINLLTLLALVLAIGLVVDDAIIVVENVDRHMKEEGKKPLEAALLAARELSGPIIAMTVVLIAVYVPIGFQKGLTGALFTEFAFTLVGAVTVSAIIALTLSPMLCSRFFRSEQESGRVVQFIDRRFDWVHRGYQLVLHGALSTWVVIVVMGALLFGATILLGMTAQSELAPEEDQGFVFYQLQGPPDATAQQMQSYSEQMFAIGSKLPEYQQMFQIVTPGTGFGGVVFKPWSDRSKSAHVLTQELQDKWSAIAGAQVFAFALPPLPGAMGAPVQMVIDTTEPFQNLNEVAQAVLQKAKDSGKFYFVDTDLKIDKPQSTLVVNRDMISTLGLTQQDVGSALGAALGGGYVNYFAIAGRSYKVIPQVQQTDRLNASQVLNYYIAAPDGSMIPASTVAKLDN
ncbi:MAG: efflux RND transporter permease subunit, partial [Rhodanobacteraceae bacterium]